ncbi:MAG: oxidoreductase [Chryseobacterium sp.]|nr:MAG: oxidoreductase [Chryseobacterium sp.]
MEKIKTGLCAFGMSGKLFHAPFLHNHPSFELTAVTQRHASDVKDIYPEVKLYRSAEEMMADPEIELVVVNSPVQTHFSFAKSAIENGKHVIVEKPFTVNASEAEELERLARERSVLLSVYQNRRWDGDFLKVNEIISSGRLGEIKEAELRFDRYRPQPSGKIHKESNLPGAGALHDLGAHLIDQALILFGMPEKIFADVFAMRPRGEANDYFDLTLFYPNHLRVRIKSSVFAAGKYYEYVIHGSNGSFLQERTDPQERELANGTQPSLQDWLPPYDESDGVLQLTESEATQSMPGNYMHYYDEIYRALRCGGQNPVPAEQAVNTMKVIDAALKSSAESCVMPVR